MKYKIFMMNRDDSVYNHFDKHKVNVNDINGAAANSNMLAYSTYRNISKLNGNTNFNCSCYLY